MPLLVFDILKGRSEAQIAAMLDAAHEAMVAAFQVPVRDRYQIVHEHEPGRMIVQDTGLGIERTPDLTLVRVVTRPRTREAKQAFYRLLADGLERACAIRSSDLVVSVVINAGEDWSFGHGRAQFLTGEL